MTEKGEASNVAILSSTSNQSNGEDKEDNNVVDSGSWMLVWTNIFSPYIM